MLKKPESLIGFICYDDSDYPFEFDEEAFTLTLFPPTIEKWEQGIIPMADLFKILYGDDKKHEWIGEKKLQGVTSEGKKIIFNVSDDRSNYNGFFSYKVLWYFYYSEALDPEKISGFKISGEEVNFFFPPCQAFRKDIKFDDSGRAIKEMSVVATEKISKPCGKYRVALRVDADVEVETYAIMHSFNVAPLDATSIMVTTFSSAVGLDILASAFRYTQCFFEYIAYRTNISICQAEVFSTDADKKRDYQGLLVFKNDNQPELYNKAEKRIIEYALLQNRAAKLFTAIKNKRIDFQYLCASIDDTRHYPASRIIMILAEFEREYRTIFGVDCIRSGEYHSVKDDIVSLIGGYSSAKHGKAKKYAKQLQKYVENRDSSFEDNLKNALLQNKEIMLPFVQNKYNGTYEDIVDGLSSRMGIVRNGIAHSRLDLQFDAIHLSDIKTVEELLYAIRLKYISVPTQAVRQAIKNLFGESISISDK